jgi:hypothetical protein
MTVTQDTDTTGVAPALALATVLGLGLPVPSLISIYSGWEVRLQFSGPDGAAAVSAWAIHFGADVEISDSSTRGTRWHDVQFAYSGQDFHAYAEVAK